MSQESDITQSASQSTQTRTNEEGGVSLTACGSTVYAIGTPSLTQSSPVKVDGEHRGSLDAMGGGVEMNENWFPAETAEESCRTNPR